MKKDTLLAHIQSTSRELMKQFEFLNDRFSAIGSSLHYHALIELNTYKILSMKQLSSLLNLEKHTTSRLVAQLIKKEICQIKLQENDRRFKFISLTPTGSELVREINTESHLHIQKMLALIDKKEQTFLSQGLSLYTKILKQFRLQEESKIRKVLKKDISQLHSIYKHAQTRSACNLDAHPTAVSFFKMDNKEVPKALTQARSNYFVIEHKAEILGGAGYRPLSEVHPEICVIEGLHISLSACGAGLCKILMQTVLQHAKLDGFKQCYLEDYGFMQDKFEFYRKLGFRRLDDALIPPTSSSTNHWYVKKF